MCSALLVTYVLCSSQSNMTGPNETIYVLAVVAPKDAGEIASIVAQTPWQLRIAHSIADAIQAARTLPISVVMCEDELADGIWLDLVSEIESVSPTPCTVVLSASSDRRLWAEVLSCGGYDLLARPLVADEIYEVVPMAWRHSKSSTEKRLEEVS